MKIVVLYRPNSEHERVVEVFIRDFKYQHQAFAAKIDAVNLDTRDGASMATLYDIMQYPAVLAVADDGSLLKMWQGSSLPLMDEVSGYLYNS